MTIGIQASSSAFNLLVRFKATMSVPLVGALVLCKPEKGLEIPPVTY